MKNFRLQYIGRKLFTASVIASALFNQTQAAPLPNGTLLGIDQGVGSATNIPCSTGSCFGMEVAPGLSIWLNFGPGTDSGFVIGKNQASGGQETGVSTTNTTPGELTNAWLFWNYGTFYTPAGSTNIFDDTPCAGTSCIGKIEISSLNMAWNGVSAPTGNANGCNSFVCSPEELSGDFITNYTIGSNGQPWSIHYHNVITDGDPSSFGNVKFQFLARGVAVIPTPIPTPAPTLAPTPIPSAVPTPMPCPYPISPTTGSTIRLETQEGIPVNFTVFRDFWGSCSTIGKPSNGINTFDPSSCTGVYTPNPNFSGIDSFPYSFAGEVMTERCFYDVITIHGTVEINVLATGPTPTPIPTTCEGLHPQTEVTMIGKGKTLAVEETLTTAFKGHIVSTDEATGKVTICRGSTVRYEVTSTVGMANCTVKHGVSTKSTGTLTDKGKLVCTNKPDGKDTDKFKIKRSKKKDVALERRWFR